MRVILVSALALGLTACGGSKTGSTTTVTDKASVTLTNASEAQVAAKIAEVKKANLIDHGAWETKFELVSLDFPGLAADDPARLTAIDELTRPMPVLKQCVNADSSIAANPVLTQGVGKDCVYSNYAMGNGKIAAEAVCKGAQGQRVTLKLAGTYSKTQADIVREEHVEAPAGQKGAQDIKLHITARRTGDCKA